VQISCPVISETY